MKNEIKINVSEAIEAARAILSDSVSKSLLIERITTKLEEFREALPEDTYGNYDRGIIHGLYIALDIIDSTSPGA